MVQVAVLAGQPVPPNALSITARGMTPTCRSGAPSRAWEVGTSRARRRGWRPSVSIYDAPTSRCAQEGTPNLRHSSTGTGDNEGVSIGEELAEERRRRRRAGDPRLTTKDRELLRRLTDGDLKEEFQAALDAVSDSDPLFSGDADPEHG